GRKWSGERGRRSSSVEDLLGLSHAFSEALDVRDQVVDVEARAGRRGQAELGVERHRAVVPRSDRDPFVVQDRRDVMGVDVVDREGDDAAALRGGGAVDGDAGARTQYTHDLLDKIPTARVPG